MSLQCVVVCLCSSRSAFSDHSQSTCQLLNQSHWLKTTTPQTQKEIGKLDLLLQFAVGVS